MSKRNLAGPRKQQETCPHCGTAVVIYDKRWSEHFQPVRGPRGVPALCDQSGQAYKVKKMKQ